MLGIIIFAVWLRWLPTGGRGSWEQLVLPAATLAFNLVALIARVTRSCMLDVLKQDYVRTARAKGVWERRVIWLHALRNAFIPVLTVIGLQVGLLLGGVVVTETIFSWPGVGRSPSRPSSRAISPWCRRWSSCSRSLSSWST